MRITDAHMHVGLSGLDADGIVLQMDRRGIERCWILTWEERHPPVRQLHLDLPVEKVLEACARHPDRFVPFHAPDPSSVNLEEQFAAFPASGIRGCGELKVSMKWEDPLLEDYLSQIQHLGLALVFHMENPRMHYVQEREGFFHWMLERLMNDKFNGVSRYYLSRFADQTGILQRRIRRNQVFFPGILYDFEALEKRIVQFPGIRFIGHGPGFWNNIGSFLHPRYIHQKGPIGTFGIIDRLLETHGNLYCDISGTSGFNALKRDPQKSRIFIQKHITRILFGTDNTDYPLMELLRSMKLGKEPLEMILNRNADKVLG